VGRCVLNGFSGTRRGEIDRFFSLFLFYSVFIPFSLGFSRFFPSDGFPLDGLPLHRRVTDVTTATRTSPSRGVLESYGKIGNLWVGVIGG
jgi:hypothetical protein